MNNQTNINTSVPSANPIHQSIVPLRGALKHLTQPAILQQIGLLRVTKFLDGFSDDLSQFQPKEDLVGPLPPAGEPFKVQSSMFDVQSSSSSAPLPLTDSPTHPLTTPPSPAPNSQHSTLQLSTSPVAPWPQPVNGK